MKKLLYLGTLILGIILTASCGHTQEKKRTVKTLQGYQISEQIDTSEYFIVSLLNCSPIEVAKQLGDPDEKIKPSNDCDYLPSCYEANYKNGIYNVLYYNNKLKWIVVNVKGLYILDNSAICYVGFPSCVPTFSNPPYGIWWRNSETKGTATGPLIPIKGIRQVCAFPKYILITVETNYDKKFERLNKQTRDKANTETQVLEKVEAEKFSQHKKMIEEQFSSWDGSHINLTKEIKKAMNDPSSYEHITTKYFDFGDYIKVVTEFRGTNSFGAKVKNTITAKVGLDGHIIEMETLD